jgi:hypothetical protein
LPLLDATAECDKPPIGNGEFVWVAMVGLDRWGCLMAKSAAGLRPADERGHLGTLALERADWLPHRGTKCDVRLAGDEPCEASPEGEKATTVATTLM